MYQVFEHTADIGLELRADSLEELLVDGARGLFSLIVENPEDVEARETVTIGIEGDDPEYLLFDWLNELLYLFDTRKLLLTGFAVELGDGKLTATACGETSNPGRHRLDHEVKAITYHGLEVKQHDGSWSGRVIVDI